MNKSKIVAFVLLAVIVLAAGGAAAYYFTTKAALEKEAAAAQAEELVSAPEAKLPGTYEVVFEYTDSTARFTGKITEGVSSDFVLTIMSEYAPRVIMMNVGPDGAISSEELGKGYMYHMESLDKTTVKFTKEDYTCTLIK